MGTVGAVIGVTALIVTCIIPLLREVVYFFFYARMKVADFFDIQADLLQINATNLRNNTPEPDAKTDEKIAKQLKIVELFRKSANKISFTAKKAEVDSTKEITSQNHKIKSDEIVDDSNGSLSALF